jgi:hypothetical protein
VSRIGSWLVLSFRLHRWEVLASAAGTAVLAGLMLFLASQLRQLAAIEPGCPDPTAYVAGCEQFVERFSNLGDWGRRLLLVSWGAPFGMGLVLGVPLVSRELEHRTAGMAWSLSRSRTWWLAKRVFFLALVLIGLLGVVAVVSEMLAAAMLPTLTLDSDFAWHGRRGFLIVARGLVALGIGVVVGAVVGRLLPALLVAALASALVFVGLSLGMDRWNETEALATPFNIDETTGEPDRAGGLLLGLRLELPSGELVGEDVASQLGEDQMIDNDGAIYTRFDEATGQPDRSSLVGWLRDLVVPGRLYPLVRLRESAVAVGVAMVLMLLGAGVVRRRRPG